MHCEQAFVLVCYDYCRKAGSHQNRYLSSLLYVLIFTSQENPHFIFTFSPLWPCVDPVDINTLLIRVKISPKILAKNEMNSCYCRLQN